VSPISPRSAAAANPNASAHVCSPKPSDARSNHLGCLDPHHLPALAWSPLSFLCAVTVARRRSRVVTMAMSPPFRPIAVARMPACATTRAPVWRGQGQAFGSLSRLTSSALHPATGRGFAANGNPSPPEARAPTQSRSCTLALAHVRANPVVALTPRAKLKHPVRDRPVALLHLAAEDVLPPRRTSVSPSQCTCSSTRTHVGEHPGVPPRNSPPWPSHRHACALK
jgi:hypothetical protein